MNKPIQKIKLLTVIIFLIGLLLPLTSFAYIPQANDIELEQIGPTGSGTPARWVSITSSDDGLIGWSKSTLLPTPMNLGTGLSFDGTSINISGLSTSSITGLQSALDTLTANLTSLQTQLSGKASTTSLVNPDWNAVSGFAQILNKPTIINQICYEGITQRANCIPVAKSVTVSSGVAVFNLTTDGTSGATSLFPNGVVQDSVGLIVNDALASYQMSYIFSNSNKTITVTANKLGTANLISGILGQVAANGAVIKLTVLGY